MIRKLRDYDPDAPIIVLDIGNTKTHIATWHHNELQTPLAVASDDDKAVTDAIQAHLDTSPDRTVAAAVISSVVAEATERVAKVVQQTLDSDALIVGHSIPLPMDVDVKDAGAVGVDRICAAYAAYEKLETGCTVVDFGTAVTVDLVDDEGAFLGGAILPGLDLQLRSLHEQTSALPLATPYVPALPYGRSTEEAIQTGVCRGLAGAVRALVEGYAAHLCRWPQTIATGGDLAFMKTHVDFIDTFVTDLTLRGIGLSYTKHLSERGA